MKTRLTSILLAFVLIGSTALLNSCKKDDDSSTGTPNPPQKNSVEAIIATKALDPAGDPIFTYESDGKFSFTVNDKDQATTLAVYFNVNDGSEQSFQNVAFGHVQLDATTHGLYVSDGGTLTLTTNDKAKRIVAGTFVFSAKNDEFRNVDVSFGKFYIKY